MIIEFKLAQKNWIVSFGILVYYQGVVIGRIIGYKILNCSGELIITVDIEEKSIIEKIKKGIIIDSSLFTLNKGELK